MDGFKLALFTQKSSPSTEGGTNLKRQEEIKHKMNEFESRWEGIETQNATWWQETSNNLKKEFRPEVLEKLKDLPLFSSNLPPLDTKFDLHNIDTKGIVLTQQEKEAVEDKIKRFDKAVIHSSGQWNDIQNDIRNMKLSPQETDELKKTESVLLFTEKLPPSRYQAKENYKREQEQKKATEERIRKEQEKKDFSLKINEALGTENPRFASLATSTSLNDFDKHFTNLTVPPPPNDFDKHLLPRPTVLYKESLSDTPLTPSSSPSIATPPIKLH